MSTPNPVMNKLGLADDDRAVIFHADDVGNMQSSLDAYGDLLDAGLLSSASTMVPCSWFPATAAYCRANAGHPNLDMGIHLTLTSEWDAYRWGPISACAPAMGLIDGDGYFHGTSDAVHAAADAGAVRQELRAQIERALAAGIDATHIDSHMFTLFHPRFVDIYIELGLEFGLPPFLLRRSVPEFQDHGAAAWNGAALQKRVAQWEERGLPLFDDATVLPLDQPLNRGEQLRRKIENLKPGITYLIVHPTKDSPELRAAAERDWPSRVADYEAFLDAELGAELRAGGVHLLGYRTLRELMPKSGSA